MKLQITPFRWLFWLCDKIYNNKKHRSSTGNENNMPCYPERRPAPSPNAIMFVLILNTIRMSKEK